MRAADLVRLASRHTVARMLERDDFAKRYGARQPIAIHEFLYPLIQGYDSLALQADVELGGTDQKFNLLVGRELQRQQGGECQCILTMPLLEGVDGVRKMSKSYGNHIGLDEPPAEIYGKLMSVSDDLMWRYYHLLSAASGDEINAMRAAANAGENPVIYKRALAAELTARFHGAAAAAQAAADFTRLVGRKEAPAAMPEYSPPAGEDMPPLFFILKHSALTTSSSHAKRLIAQGAVKIDGEKITDPDYQLPVGRQFVLQAGKRKFMRIKT